MWSEYLTACGAKAVPNIVFKQVRDITTITTVTYLLTTCVRYVALTAPVASLQRFLNFLPPTKIKDSFAAFILFSVHVPCVIALSCCIAMSLPSVLITYWL